HLRERDRRKTARVEIRIGEEPDVFLRVGERYLLGNALRQHLVLDLHVPEIGAEREARDIPTPADGPLLGRLRLEAGLAGEPVGAGEQVVLRASGDTAGRSGEGAGIRAGGVAVERQ